MNEDSIDLYVYTKSAFSLYEFDYIPEIRRQTKLVHVSQS